MSALTRYADLHWTSREVREVPIATEWVAVRNRLFNHSSRARRCRRNGGEIDAAERHNPSQRMEPSEGLAQQQDAERCTKHRKQIAEIPRRLRADSHYAKIPTRETHDARGQAGVANQQGSTPG